MAAYRLSLRIPYGFLVIFFLTALASGSCTRKGDEKKSIQGSSLEGVWVAAACTKEVDSSPPVYFKEEVSIAGDRLSYTVRSFSDSVCTAKIDSESFTSTFKTGDSTALPTTSVADATNIDLVIQSSTYAAHTDPLISLLNQNSFCGKSQWEKDAPTDISLCANANFRKDLSLFLIYKLTGANLYWGLLDATNNGTQADKRSKSLNSDPLIKQS